MGEYIVIDAGTTSVKLTRFSDGLEILAENAQTYGLIVAGAFTEAPPDSYLSAVCRGIRQLGDCGHVTAICITTQGETLIPLDADGRPLGNAIVWLDKRAPAEAAELRRSLGDQYFYQKTGLPSVGAALPLCKLLWLRRRRPDLWKKTEKIMLLEDYLIFWLTGRFVTEKSLQTSTGWFCLECDSYWDEALSAAGIPRSFLPEAINCGDIAGTLLPARADALGLPGGVRVVAGAMDQTAAALAAGCSGPGTLCETTGTAMVAAAWTKAPVFREAHHLTIYRGVTAGSYLYLPISSTAGMALKWLKGLLADEAISYRELDRMAASVAAGSEGLLFLPYLSGEVDPVLNENATACFFGLRLSHGRGHLIRAVLEAVGFQLRDFLSMLRSLGCGAEQVCSLGGGSLSPLWMQIKADICRLPFLTLRTAQATSYGAAMLTAYAMTGSLPAPLQPAAQFLPQSGTEAIYERQYELYAKLHAALQPLYLP